MQPKFGGGDGFSSMTPVVLAATLIAALLVLVLPRKYAVAPILVVVFLTPFGQQIYFSGLHFYAIRIIILAGCLRMLSRKMFSREPIFAGGLQSFDKLFILLVFVTEAAFILLYRESGAVIAMMAFGLDSYGGYFLFRHLIQDKEDIVWVTKVFAMIVAVLGLVMFYEHLAGVNAFSLINYGRIVPEFRDNGFRAEGVFGGSVTAGCFGATLVPLFYWLWKSKARVLASIGLVSAGMVVYSSVSSTAVMAYIGGILALCMWPLRKNMRTIRWGLAFMILGLALVMKAPVWFIIARIDFIGGHGWDRAELIDQFVHHFSEWWLLGAKDNAGWAADTWDACNEFVATGLSGGLLGFGLFIALLSRCFAIIGRSRKHAEGTSDEWLVWCVGAALFAHVTAFWGVDYFDNVRVSWLAFLAILSAVPAVVTVAEVSPQPASPFRWAVPRPATVGATGKTAYSSAQRTFRQENQGY